MAMGISGCGVRSSSQAGYAGEAGPENWGRLDPQYAACESGKNQSPIDLSNLIEAELAPIAFAYRSGTK